MGSDDRAVVEHRLIDDTLVQEKDGCRDHCRRRRRMTDPSKARGEIMTVADRPGLITSRTHPLIRELRKLAKRHGLQGCVLVSFSAERVAVNSCGEPDLFGKAMEQLADRILAKIDDGEFNPTVHLQ